MKRYQKVITIIVVLALALVSVGFIPSVAARVYAAAQRSSTTVQVSGVNGQMAVVITPRPYQPDVSWNK